MLSATTLVSPAARVPRALEGHHIAVRERRTWRRHNQAATACPPTGRVRYTVRWCHLSRVSPALDPPKRPPLPPLPPPPPNPCRKLIRGFGGRGTRQFHPWNKSVALYYQYVLMYSIASHTAGTDGSNGRPVM